MQQTVHLLSSSNSSICQLACQVLTSLVHLFQGRLVLLQNNGIAPLITALEHAPCEVAKCLEVRHASSLQGWTQLEKHSRIAQQHAVGNSLGFKICIANVVLHLSATCHHCASWLCMQMGSMPQGEQVKQQSASQGEFIICAHNGSTL